MWDVTYIATSTQKPSKTEQINKKILLVSLMLFVDDKEIRAFVIFLCLEFYAHSHFTFLCPFAVS